MLADASRKKTDPVLHAFPALKGPFSQSFHHFCGVILYVNFLFFTRAWELLFVRDRRHRSDRPRSLRAIAQNRSQAAAPYLSYSR